MLACWHDRHLVTCTMLWHPQMDSELLYLRMTTTAFLVNHVAGFSLFLGSVNNLYEACNYIHIWSDVMVLCYHITELG